VMALVILELIIISLLAVLVIGLLRSHAEILRRLHELGAGIYEEGEDAEPAGTGASGVTTRVELGERAPAIRTRDGVPTPRLDDTPAHDISGLSPTGSASAIGVVDTTHFTLLAFLSSGCGTCADFWRAFTNDEATALPGEDTRLVIVTKGPESESPAAVQTLAPPRVTTVMSTQAYTDYGVPVSPYFILVDGPDGRVIGEGAAATWTQVANLLRQALADAGHPSVASSPASPAGLNGAARETRADDELLAAGIGPGHPSLYPNATPPEGDR
jgi:hypothetical protein